MSNKRNVIAITVVDDSVLVNDETPDITRRYRRCRYHSGSLN